MRQREEEEEEQGQRHGEGSEASTGEAVVARNIAIGNVIEDMKDIRRRDMSK